MLLLGLDTATPAVTAALSRDGEVLATASLVDAAGHAEHLVPLVVRVLDEAGTDRSELDAVVVGTGPGPFTGLRVGLVTARVLGLALGVEVLGVCSLDAIALDAVDALAGGGRMRVVTDARRREVYWAEYDGVRGADGVLRPRRTVGPTVGAPATAATRLPAAGAGALAQPEAFPAARGPADVDAGALCRWVAAGLPTTAPEPMYLRRPDAVAPGARKSALGPAAAPRPDRAARAGA